jgi:hypothetical protein
MKRWGRSTYGSLVHLEVNVGALFLPLEDTEGCGQTGDTYRMKGRGGQESS